MVPHPYAEKSKAKTGKWLPFYSADDGPDWETKKGITAPLIAWGTRTVLFMREVRTRPIW